MKVMIDSNTGKRRAVLRPPNTALSLRRLKEWNQILDEAEALPVEDRPAAFERARVLWVQMLREQPWTFLGWLGEDLKTVVWEERELGLYLAGDVMMKEDDYVEFLQWVNVQIP